jgi:hypothetical protein
MSPEARDTTALVLSLGEPTLAHCLAALRAQTLPPARVVLVENVHGFHEAFNQGLEQVETPYVLQCDADMLLDPDCLALLRAAMAPGLGVCAAYLEDALLGKVQAVKLFRTEAVRRHGLPARLNTDIHGIHRMGEDGYAIRFVERAEPAYGHAPGVLGRHCPDYEDPAVVFGRFHRMGRKLRIRGDHAGFRQRLRLLGASRHEQADVAAVALCEGICDDSPETPHEPFAGSPVLDALLAFRGRTRPQCMIRQASAAPVRIALDAPPADAPPGDGTSATASGDAPA